MLIVNVINQISPIAYEESLLFRTRICKSRKAASAYFRFSKVKNAWHHRRRGAVLLYYYLFCPCPTIKESQVMK